MHKFTRLIAALALTFVSVVGVSTLASAGGKGEGHSPVTFCHNGHTITTDDDGQIKGHLKHVDQGKDSLGECPPTSTPTPTPSEPEPTEEPTETPTPEPSEEPTIEPTPEPTEEPTSEPTPTTTPSETPITPVVTPPAPVVSEVHTVAEPTTTLAETGVNGWLLAGAGAALVGIGVGLIYARRRYNTHL